MVPKTKEEAVQKAYDIAFESIHKYHGWSQCTVLAVQDVLDMRDDNIFKAASSLSGGIGHLYDVCGALLGGSMMLSLHFGRSREEIADQKKLYGSHEPVGRLYKWFEKEFGGVKCRDVRTRFAGGVFYDTDVPWQAELAKEASVSQQCHVLTAKTAARVTGMLWDALHGEKVK